MTEADLRSALQKEPTRLDLLMSLGVLLDKKGENHEAETVFRRAHERYPRHSQLASNLGLSLYKLGRLEECIPFYRLALQGLPNDPDLLTWTAAALNYLGEFEESESCLNRALEVAPTHDDACNQKGRFCRQRGDSTQASNWFRRTLAQHPEHPEARLNLGIIQLARGRWSSGWRHYVHRHNWTEPRLALPSWAEYPSGNHTDHLLLLSEQGLGDELFFLRFAPSLAVRGLKLTYRCSPKLAPLLASLPWMNSSPSMPDKKAFDRTLWVGDLPLLLGADKDESLPPPLKLSPAPTSLHKIDNFFPKKKNQFVGLTWRAGLRGHSKLHKEMPIEALIQALNSLDATGVVLQRDPEARELELLHSKCRLPPVDLSALNDNLEDMLAALSLLDEIWGVSNTNVHMAAGLGVSLRVFVPWPAEWRWMESGDKSPWFKGATLYRETPSGGWASALESFFKDIISL